MSDSSRRRERPKVLTRPGPDISAATAVISPSSGNIHYRNYSCAICRSKIESIAVLNLINVISDSKGNRSEDDGFQMSFGEDQLCFKCIEVKNNKLTWELNSLLDFLLARIHEQKIKDKSPDDRKKDISAINKLIEDFKDKFKNTIFILNRVEKYLLNTINENLLNQSYYKEIIGGELSQRQMSNSNRIKNSFNMLLGLCQLIVEKDEEKTEFEKQLEILKSLLSEASDKADKSLIEINRLIKENDFLKKEREGANEKIHYFEILLEEFQKRVDDFNVSLVSSIPLFIGESQANRERNSAVELANALAKNNRIKRERIANELKSEVERIISSYKDNVIPAYNSMIEIYTPSVTESNINTIEGDSGQRIEIVQSEINNQL